MPSNHTADWQLHTLKAAKQLALTTCTETIRSHATQCVAWSAACHTSASLPDVRVQKSDCPVCISPDTCIYWHLPHRFLHRTPVAGHAFLASNSARMSWRAGSEPATMQNTCRCQGTLMTADMRCISPSADAAAAARARGTQRTSMEPCKQTKTSA